jgi:hypothetical protein
MALYSSSSFFSPCLSLPSTFSLPLSVDCYRQQNASILGLLLLLLLLLLVPSQLCRSSLHLRRKCKQKNAAKKFWSKLEKKENKNAAAAAAKKKNISAQQLRSSEGKKREKFCLRSTFVSFDETEAKCVRLVGTSMFFFANLEGFSQIWLQAKYVSKISLKVFLYFWLPT